MEDLFNFRKREQQLKRKQSETNLKRANELEEMVSVDVILYCNRYYIYISSVK